MSLPSECKPAAIVAPSGATIEPYRLLVELQAQIITVRRQNAEMEQECSALRTELVLRKSPGFLRRQTARKLKSVAGKSIVPTWLKLLKSRFAAMP
jgi:hypothetical protein